MFRIVKQPLLKAEELLPKAPAPSCSCSALQAQVEYLAGQLSAARILVNNASCCRCGKMSFEACASCWIAEAKSAS